MTRIRSPSTSSASVSQVGESVATNSRPTKMHRTVSFNALPATKMDLSNKVPHTRRVAKSKTCYSFLSQSQQQGDVELATSIGHDLLLEVKKMQGLLQEKNDCLTTLFLEKADTQQELDQLKNQLKQCSEALELGKEQNWNLELEKQELSQQVDDLQQQVQRSVTDQTKLIGQESDLKQELEHLKQQQVTWQEAMEQSNQDKVDLAITRRKLAALQRQVSSNKVMVDASRVSFAGGFRPTYQADTFRFSLPPDPQLNLSHLMPSHSLPPVSSSSSTSIPTTTTAAPSSCSISITKNVRQQQRQQQDEFHTINADLQASLQAANDTIQALQHSLEDEQKKRAEMELLWRDAQEVIENEIDDDDNVSTTPPPPSSSPHIEDQQDDFDNVLLTGLDKSHEKEPQTSLQLNRRVFNKEKRNNRQKCLSLGDELSLAGPGGIFPQFSTIDLDPTTTNDNDLLEIPKTSSSSPPQPTTTTRKWLSETLTNQTNLDDIMALNAMADRQASPTATISHHINHENNDKNDHHPKSVNNSTSINSIRNSINKNSNNGGISTHLLDNHNNKGISRSDSKQVYVPILANESYTCQTSISLLSSQHDEKDTSRNTSGHGIERNNTEGRANQYLTSSNSSSDGKRCIRALTRTMIGNWMWKYTRKMVGNGISENRHKRFFWLHPYSKTLYWSTQEPGADGYEYNTKCVMIESFMVIDDGDVTSFYIQTSGRGIKIQCTDESSHREWFKSLKYLLIDAPPLASSILQQQPSLDSNTKKTKQHLKMNQQRLTKLLQCNPPNMTTHGTRVIARLRPDCQHAFATMSGRQASHQLDSTLSALAAAATSSNRLSTHSLPLKQTGQSPSSSPPPSEHSETSHDETDKTRGGGNNRFGSHTPAFMKLVAPRREY